MGTLGSSLTTTPSWGRRGRVWVGVGEVWRRKEVIWVEGGWGESWRHLFFYFPQPLAFFGFSPHNFLIRAKMHKLKKEAKGERQDPILTHPVWGHQGGGPNEGGWVVVFLLGGWKLAPRSILKNWDWKLEWKGIIISLDLRNLKKSLQRLPTVCPGHSFSRKCN